ATSSAGSFPTSGRRSSGRRESWPGPGPQESKKGPPRWWPFWCSVALAAGGDWLRKFREHLERLLAQLLVVVEAGPGGDQLADDHVLLQTTEPVDLARDGGFGQHPRRLLEGCRRQPARRVERGLDQAEQDGLRHRRIAAFRQHFGVRFLVLPLGDDLARQQVGVLACLHSRTRLDRRLHLVRADVRDVVAVARGDLALAGGLGPDDLHLPVDLGDDRLALRDAGFEQLLDARQALRDVGAGAATGMERPHGQLRTGFADRLGGDDAKRLTDLDQLAGRQVAAVAQAAHTFARLAGEHRANFDLGNARLDQVARLDVADLGAFFDERLLRVGV